MKRIPDGHRVTQALKSADKTIQQSLGKLNKQAGQLMERGDYHAAEILAASGRELQAFRAEFEVLRKKWNEIRRDAKSAHTNNSTTPLWGYYQPILQALSEIGGEATRTDLEPYVERVMRANFQPGDTDPMSKGCLRWQSMVRKAHRHLLKEVGLKSVPGNFGVSRLRDGTRPRRRLLQIRRAY